jgi:hypothetical protein
VAAADYDEGDAEEAPFAMARVRALAEAECFPSLGQGEVRSEWIVRWGEPVRGDRRGREG